MVSVISLGIPIVASAVIVFVASSILHMVVPFHRNDLKRLPAEDEIMDALRTFNIPPGDYVAPRPDSPKDMGKPEFTAKVTRGPLVLMTIAPGGSDSMAKNLFLWFLYSVVVSLFASYVAGRALGPGAAYLAVFRFVGTTAFMGYSLALAQHSIWYRRDWGTTLKSMVDGLVYGLLTAGTFGWLWPR